MRFFRILPVLLGALIISGCATTKSVKIDNSWINGDYRGGPLKKILVVGLGPNAAGVKLWEDSFVQALSKAGYEVTPAYTVFPKTESTGDEAADLEAAKQKIRDMGFDGVILGKIRDVESGPVREGGEIEMVATPAYYSWYSYYQPQVFAVQTETRVVNVNRVRVETNIYAVKGEIMVYTAMIDSINATNNDTAIRGLVDAVISDLKKRKVL